MWSECSRTCDSGHQTRQRTISLQAKYGGLQCTGEPTQTQQCNTQSCPVNCVWNHWSSWSDCSKSCNSGHQTRERTIAQQANSWGEPCTGEPTQTQQCNTQSCPVNCKWGQWSSWSECSKSCDGGTQNRYRSKIQIAKFGGLQCLGQTNGTRLCNQDPCISKSILYA